MRTAQLIIGPPGSGKSTYTNGMQQFLSAIGRKCSTVNLDPANDNLTYTADLDLTALVSLDEVMEQEDLGPNGGVMWAMEELENNMEWLEQGLEGLEEYLLVDCPGQVELFTHHESLPRVFQRLEKLGYRLVVIQLLDSMTITRPSLYLSSLLLALRSMLHLPYPLVNVLTKIDNLATQGGKDLPFNLDFYTEVQDLSHLLPHLEQEQATALPKFKGLNEAIVGLIEDFGLVSFETLAVEDRESMYSLLKAIDRASGYLFQDASDDPEGGVWATVMRDDWTGKMDVRDVQERWIDRKDELDEMERKQWAEEAMQEKASAAVRRAGNEQVAREEALRPKPQAGDAGGGGDEDLEKMQEEFMRSEERSEGGIKVVRKT